nr:SpoIIIAC/SpoIIIAD family protein [uncultured Acetatifactor sp.]
MGEIIKVGLLGIVGVLLAVQFKGQKPEYGIYMGFAVGILIFCYVLRQVEAVVAQLDLIQTYLGGASSYLSILLKVIGITYICEFSAGICKDAGYGAIADQIEILGKLSVMFAGLPILFAVIDQIQSFMG